MNKRIKPYIATIAIIGLGLSVHLISNQLLKTSITEAETTRDSLRDIYMDISKIAQNKDCKTGGAPELHITFDQLEIAGQAKHLHERVYLLGKQNTKLNGQKITVPLNRTDNKNYYKQEKLDLAGLPIMRGKNQITIYNHHHNEKNKFGKKDIKATLNFVNAKPTKIVNDTNNPFETFSTLPSKEDKVIISGNQAHIRSHVSNETDIVTIQYKAEASTQQCNNISSTTKEIQDLIGKQLEPQNWNGKELSCSGLFKYINIPMIANEKINLFCNENGKTCMNNSEQIKNIRENIAKINIDNIPKETINLCKENSQEYKLIKNLNEENTKTTPTIKIINQQLR